MSENKVLKTGESQPIEEKQKDTIPNDDSQIIVPIKFNKETINLNLEQAQELAQKGMKFDMIAADYEEIKSLAKANGKNVSEYIASLKEDAQQRRLAEVTEKCGGDNEFAEHILKLENGEGVEIRGFEELKKCFPKIKSIEDLPESVVEAAKLKGTLILDEYLRFLHNQKKVINETVKKQDSVKQSSLGPLANKSDSENPETAEFLRGLWRR